MLDFYRDTCLPWIEDNTDLEATTTNCSACGIDTGRNDILCDDCDCTADSEADEYSDPNESHWAGEDRHYYNNER